MQGGKHGPDDEEIHGDGQAADSRAGERQGKLDAVGGEDGELMGAGHGAVERRRRIARREGGRQVPPDWEWQGGTGYRRASYRLHFKSFD